MEAKGIGYPGAIRAWHLCIVSSVERASFRYAIRLMTKGFELLDRPS
jgi:hypothetical protein